MKFPKAGDTLLHQEQEALCSGKVDGVHRSEVLAAGPRRVPQEKEIQSMQAWNEEEKEPA